MPELEQTNNTVTKVRCPSGSREGYTLEYAHTKLKQTEQYLYFSGSCFRMSRTEEMAYSPVSSVSTITKLVVLPAPETVKKNCKQCRKPST